jgi:hypothetical protein
MKTEFLIGTILVTALVTLCCRSLSAENIDPYEDDSQYACGENVGWLNFEPNRPEPNAGATVSEYNVTGFIWAENIGWINLAPNYADPNTGVHNDGTGRLSGLAWGENVGWINFDPNVPGDSNDYGVRIDGDGDFNGWAWGENIGWINFNSADLYGYNVQVCKVNFTDLGNFVDDWLATGVALPADLTGDNDVNFPDYSMFALFWLSYCPDEWPLK